MPPVDLTAIRTRLEKSQGREYWRSLEELGGTEEFKDFIEHEFPRDVELWMEPVSRRDFLKMMGAGFALAFFTACRRPLEQIIPYNSAPEHNVAGKPLYYASALPFQGYARGVLIENHLGRPTKIEGNPEHPDSLGASDSLMQGAILSFYDPDRSQVVLHNGVISTWDTFFAEVKAALGSSNGAGLRILTETITSPTLADRLNNLLKAFPGSQWHAYEPVSRDAVYEGARLAFGERVETQYHFERANVILSLDADFLTAMPGSLRYTRAFTDGRRMVEGRTTMNRLYVAEPSSTITGSMADHRLPVRFSDVLRLTQALADELGVASTSSNLDGRQTEWIHAVARDLKSRRGESLVIAGAAQPAAVHALVHAINAALGNAGKTVSYTEPVDAHPMNQLESLQTLVADMNAGRVGTLLMFEGNPAYDAPADLDFAGALSKVPFRAHLSLHQDETSSLCQWHLPEAHPIESWGDLRASDGTVTILQPQVEPLYAGKTTMEVVSGIADPLPRSGHDTVHDYWQAHKSSLDFESFWRKTVHDGVMVGSAFKPKDVAIKLIPRGIISETAPGASGLEIVFKPDETVWDGRFSNNGWLQELPKPMTKLTWDNAVFLSPALAEQLHVGNGDVVEVKVKDRSVRGPVCIVPGQARESVVVSLGYGRTHAGRVGNGAGFNVYPLRASASLWQSDAVTLRPTGDHVKLATTQHHYNMEGRDLVRVGGLEEYQRDPEFAQKPESPSPKESLYTYTPPKQSEDYAWGMAIDLNACIGCNACVTACQAENNIPVVGKDQVAKGREMQWIRVDRYYEGNLDEPQSYNQPVPCMHCEDAPCEVVCPVGATTHSEEGLNQMVYNRCIGTRYCSNNCPYKVRRFNFLEYTKDVKGPLELLQNPDVTVRSRGVMEKCTYCVQRIECSKKEANKEDRKVKDGEIVTACAQACPARAIVFGNLKDPTSLVSRMKAEPRDYALLSELGTRPRTTYQARLRNLNPEIKESV